MWHDRTTRGLGRHSLDSGVVDDLALRYLLLGLRLGRVVDGFVDSFVGPPQIAEAVAAEAPTFPAALHDEAVRLRELAAELPGDDAAAIRRRRWFDGQLVAMAVLARHATGEEIEYLDLTDQLFGLRVAPAPEAGLAVARARLDAAVPGRGNLIDRLTAQRDRLRVPADRAMALLAASAARFREATSRDFSLPDDEGVDWEAARGVAWGAEASFTGHGRTRIRINLDQPRQVPTIAYLAAHEVYPGHHAEHIVKERALIRDAGLGEATLRTISSPEGLMAEGQADVAGEVVMGDLELATELAHIGGELGVDADWHAVVAAERAARELASAVGNAAIMLHHDGRAESVVREWLDEFCPQPADMREHTLAFLRDPFSSTYAFTYRDGAHLVRRWLEVQGQTTGFWRLLSEQLSPAALADDLAAADAAT